MGKERDLCILKVYEINFPLLKLVSCGAISNFLLWFEAQCKESAAVNWALAEVDGPKPATFAGGELPIN